MSERISWYRTPVDKQVLKALTRRSDIRGLVHMIPFTLMPVVTGTAALYLYLHVSAWAFAAMLFVHCSLFQFFGRVGAGHELCHHTVFRNKWLNVLFYNVFAFLAWENAVELRARHMSHHQFTAYNGKDAELSLPFFITPANWLFLVTIDLAKIAAKLGMYIDLSLGVFSPGIERLFPAGDARARARLVWNARLLVLGHLALAVWFFASGLWPLLLIVTFAPFMAQWLNMLLAFPQHVGMTPDVDDFRLSSRTYDLGPVLAFLYCNMQYHLEHHMYAGVPFYNLPALRKVIAFDLPPSSGGLIRTWGEIRHAWRMQRKDSNYTLPIALPAPDPGKQP